MNLDECDDCGASVDPVADPHAKLSPSACVALVRQLGTTLCSSCRAIEIEDNLGAQGGMG